LGADFITKTGMILDLGKARISFGSAPSLYIQFTSGKGLFSFLYTVPLSPRLQQFQCGKLSSSHKARLDH
jgi:hypothetical protein